MKPFSDELHRVSIEKKKKKLIAGANKAGTQAAAWEANSDVLITVIRKRENSRFAPRGTI